MTFLFLILFLLPSPHPPTLHLAVWCYYKSSFWKNKEKHFAWMETRYISLNPLAFNEGVHRENLMKGQGKLKEDAVIIVYGASWSALSSLSDNNYSVCRLGCKTFQEHKAPGCFILHLYPFSVHLIKLFVQFIDLGVNLETSIFNSKVWYVGNITFFFAAQLGYSFSLLYHFPVWLSLCFSL